jgi:hypothetical protein
MSGPDRHHPVVQLLNDMETLRRLLRLYPQGHPSLGPARDRLTASTAAIAAPDGVSLGIAIGQVLWNREEVTLNPAYPCHRLVGLLFQLGLAAVKLTFPAASRGLAVLAARLATVREPPGESEREQLLKAQSELPGVELVALDLSGVQLVDEAAVSSRDATRFTWSELARRWQSRGTVAQPGLLKGGQLTPESVLDLLSRSQDQTALLDHLFAQIADVVRTGGEELRVTLWREARAFLAALLGLLDPDRRAAVIVAAARRVPFAGPPGSATEDLVGAEVLVATVEHMLAHQIDVPEVVQRSVYRLVAPVVDQPGELPADVVGRARALMPLLPLAGPEPPVPDGGAPDAAAVAGAAGTSSGAAELLAALAERELHAHLLRVLGEAVTLWPQEGAGERSALRLADELVATLELGDADTAQRLATVVMSTSSAEAHERACSGGVTAAVRALRAGERRSGAAVVATLAALGERALPAVIEAVAEEEDQAVRKRLLEVISRQGQSSVRHLLPCLDDSRWYVVRNAVFILRRAGYRDMLPVIKPRLETASPQLAIEILKALVAFEDPDWLRLLQRELDNEDEQRRRGAIGVASCIRHPQVVKALVERLRLRLGLRLRDDAVSSDLISALGRLRDAAALPVLQQVIELKQWRLPFSVATLRREAAVSIAMLEGSEARHAAIALSRDRDHDLAAAVRAAMQRPAPTTEEGE